MKITANGKEFDIDGNASLPAFLNKIGFEIGMVVVERNQNALTPSEAKATLLENGDRLEIVKIVAGG